MSDRRDFVKQILAGTAGAVLLNNFSGAEAFARAVSQTPTAADPWARVPEILKRIKPPVFPKRDFVVTKYGAVADGKTVCTDAFRKAVAACNKAGGGRVVVPAGVFLTGPIHLLSNVNLHVSEGATVKFSQDPKAYLPNVFTRWEGMELMNYSPLIYAFEQKNIAITGTGTLDGNSDDEQLVAVEGAGAPRLEEGHAEPGQGAQDARRDDRARRARLRARLRRGSLPAPAVRPALPLQERAHRGRHASSTRRCGS